MCQCGDVGRVGGCPRSRKFHAYLNQEARREFISLVRHHAYLFVVQEEDLTLVVPACRDPADNKFLALALVAGAQLLISSDEDLLVLHPWCGVDIVTPKQFLDRSASPPTWKKHLAAE